MFNSDQKRAFLAVLLSGVVLFGWQYYFSSKPLPATTDVVATNATAPVSAVTNTPPVTAVASATAPSVVAVTNQVYDLVAGKSSFSLSNDLVFSSAKNSEYSADLKSLSGATQPLKIQIVSGYGPTDLVFSASENTSTKFVGTNEKFGVTFTSNLDEKGRLSFQLNSKTAYNYRFLFNAKEEKMDNGQFRQFIVYDTDVNFYSLDSDKDKEGSYKWIGLDYNYHLFALVFKEKQTAKFKTTEQGSLAFETTKASNTFDASLVFSKKNYDHLIAISNPGDNLHLSVDFGYFAILAVPILRGLQFIYKYIPNYGIAIILLTILIRLITFPLQYKSFKSMKKMQTIQPELAKIKEKYKDDNQKMQKETMALFSKAGANPLSGCLPLLLQMPFFFAIYRVLFSAVELVGAPFYGWIHDLSIQDPFYVLPVLMAASMFVQQKLTPQTSVDPTQQKVMMFMPLLFGFMMKSLPAGLVLYIFVSTSVGILQQYLVYKAID